MKEHAGSPSTGRKIPEHHIGISQSNGEWSWTLTTHDGKRELVKGTSDNALEAHQIAYLASIWFGNPEDEDDWV